MSASARTSTASHDDARRAWRASTGYPALFAELIRRGWSDEDLAKLAGGNVLRAFREAEAVPRVDGDVPPAADELTPDYK